MAISFLQAQGVEIGLVSKIAGHSSPQITLQYYTHAVREHEGMMDELNDAYGLGNTSSSGQTEVQTY
jgi:integrase